MTNSTDMSAISQELQDDEKLIWQAQPAPGAWASTWIGVALLGLAFFAFAAFSLNGASLSDEVSHTFAVPFIAIGSVLVLIPLWQYFVGKNMYYAVTDKRALLVTTFPSRTVRSFKGSDMDDVEIKNVSDDGYGTVTFARRKSGGRKSDFRPDWGFFGIEDVKSVEAELVKLKQSA